MDGYKRYNPRAEGYGSAAEWIKAAEALAAGAGTFRRIAGAREAATVDPMLSALGLDALPDDVEVLKRAMRNSMMVAHPDYGGTNDAARAVLEAYKHLLKSYR